MFGASVTFAVGSSRIEPGLTPTHPITLTWPTFKEAANQAGISRRYGGIHFEVGDMTGRLTGRWIADRAELKLLGCGSGMGKSSMTELTTLSSRNR
jgi:hypothetical protein